MNFCDADSCSSCDLAEGEPECLRHKANFCRWLAMRFPREALGAALSKLGLDLIEDSEALKRERVALARRKHAAM